MKIYRVTLFPSFLILLIMMASCKPTSTELTPQMKELCDRQQ